VTEARQATALIGEPVGSRDPRASRGWLARLAYELDELYGEERLVPFAAVGGTELRGLLAPSADPLAAVLRGALRDESRRMRWAIALAASEVPETLSEATGGEAFDVCRGALLRARRSHDALVIVTGDPGSDRLLEAIAPVLGDMLARMTIRQRTVARLLLVEGRRQAEVAERLGISRQTVSVNVARSRLRSLARLSAAVSAVYSDAVGDARVAEGPRKDPRLAAAAALRR
jgi:RNA polymerase sigma factor (sigma-70 family)